MNAIVLLRPMICCLLVWAALLVPARADEPARPPITLLVHGLTLSFKEPVQVWGTGTPGDGKQQLKAQWTGMVGHLRERGMAFGGVVQPRLGKVRLPEHLDAACADGDPRAADLFALYFSPAANVDGLAYKCAELAETLRRLREFTGAAKVRLVAHSAGGIVARAYLQELVPGIEYQGDVERLITIATPHLGSDAAEHFGEFFGTRLTCLQPSSDAVVQLNRDLLLPANVHFASIVVRALWNDTQGGGAAYDHLVSPEALATCPVDYRAGGDEILSVRTQNLRLAPAALRYERETGQAVQQVVARVPSTRGQFAHVSATQSRAVQDWAWRLLTCSDACFTGRWAEGERERWIESQAAACIASTAEEATWNHWWLSGVRDVRPRLAKVSGSGDRWQVQFEAETDWQRLCRMGSGTLRLTGAGELKADPFGRIVAVHCEIHEKTPLP